ncbi:NAD(P)-dependent dehydrogenase (short-subunit alcohol dehydrogenase family) [Curtobacterium flaccumfaciens]|uniref:NAD(P)-dependent dehydrogenase (Short-subunit alcohol dehydrogenase family) n=2 Tax=Actinomycetes TaxID=1760 RepID=A0A4R6DEJ2_9MICO|nr:SDR family oxidoreductase [Curtobacterium flaccumfaciens]TDN42369.1 NAD(P)-dependent dehydrogenase (short-subunit alcohol dehydrogenase family) [Curtobacterium flaccumfaciens]
MTNHDQKRILLVGGGSGIGHAIAAALLERGDQPIIGARDPERATAALPAALRDVPVVRADVTDEETIAALTASGPFDAVVSLAAGSANGPVGSLDQAAVRNAFDAKVVGPMLLAKHLAPSVRPGGVFVLFSGVAAWKPAPGLSVMATVNGAVSFMAEALAVELAPVRAVAVSPGIIDSGLWDFMGEDGKRDFFASTAATNPARRVGTPDDVVSAVLLAVDNTFVTGTTLHVDGGGHLA